MQQYKAVIVGCGGITGQWIPVLKERPDCQIAALVDLREESAKACAERHGLDVPVFTDLAKAIHGTGADLVMDLTIPAAHRTVVTTALQEGCHVFGEKPMAESLEDARAMLDMVRKTGRRYSVMQNYRYNKWVRTFRNVLASGRIGTPGRLSVDFSVGPHMPGFREEMKSPLLLDMAIHTFDMARLLAEGDPVNVWCREFNPRWSWFKGDAAATAVFEFSNGLMFEYRGSWCTQGAWTSWAGSWRAEGSTGSALWRNRPILGQGACGTFEDEITCSTAVAGADLNAWWNNDNWQNEVIAPEWNGQDGHAGGLDEMFASLRENRPAETDALDNIKSVAMVHAAVRSSGEGRTVPVEW